MDVRVVAATHRDLHALVAEGRFRDDLYYRLNVVQLELPPLRERREDIGLLASYFLERAARRQKRGPLELTPDAMGLLEKYDYPGNVRELENAIEHAVAVSERSLLEAADLPAEIRSPRLLARVAGRGGRGPRAAAAVRRRRRRATRSRSTRSRASTCCACSSGTAATRPRRARQLGVSRTTLWRMLRRWGVSRPTPNPR